MKTLILLAFLLISYPVFAQQKDTSDDFITTVRNTYSLMYPRSWKLNTGNTLGMDIFVRSPRTDSLDDFYENLNVYVQDLNGQSYTLSQMGTESETQIKNTITDVMVVESGLDSSGADPFYKLYFTGRQGKFLLTTLQHYYLKNGIGYAVTVTIKKEQEQEYVPVAHRMLRSFKIL